MSIASEAIADLDAEIAESGQDVVLVRIAASGPDIEKPFRAFVRGYKPSELVGGIQQGDTLVVLSPTGLPAEVADTDDTRLRENDLIGFDGRKRNVEFIETVRIGPQLVRMNVTVRG